MVSAVMQDADHRDGSVAGSTSPDDLGEVLHLAWGAWRHPAPADPSSPGYLLSVSVNVHTGYGSLVWYVITTSLRKGVEDGIWVTDNPHPPDVDPRVLADDYMQDFHEPRNTLPLNRIRAAVEEFSSAGTGSRPRSVDWAEAVDLYGRRTPYGLADPEADLGDPFSY
jgi:hypothetical protein